MLLHDCRTIWGWRWIARGWSPHWYRQHWLDLGAVQNLGFRNKHLRNTSKLVSLRVPPLLYASEYGSRKTLLMKEWIGEMVLQRALQISRVLGWFEKGETCRRVSFYFNRTGVVTSWVRFACFAWYWLGGVRLLLNQVDEKQYSNWRKENERQRKLKPEEGQGVSQC